MLNVQRTIISQYANSPTLNALIESMNEAIDPRANIAAFYDFVWNVDTAVGFGLDIWGNIVGVTRLLHIPGNFETLGFSNVSEPPDWAPFNQGTWFTGNDGTQTFELDDTAFRVLILTKALANIMATNAPSMNRLLQNLFPGRGRCYVRDNGGMSMTFVFEFSLSRVEYAILTESGALPHPAGVAYNVVVIPSGELFGFFEAGPPAQPFDSGTFYEPAG
jgi:hypothetical protein